MNPRLRLLASLLTALAWSTACAPSGPPTRPSSAAMLQEKLNALEEVRSSELRYNPAPCDCPPWELAIPDGWLRVALRGDAETLETLQEQAWTDHGSELLVTYAAEGSLSPRVLRCTPSTLCSEFTLTQWVLQEP